MISHLSNTQKGILLALAGYTSFAMSDACAKWLTLHYSVYQVIAMDTGVATLILLALAPWLGGWKSLCTKKDAKIHALRTGLNLAVNIMIVYCFTFMPLTTVYTMVFTKPFFAALLAIVLYKERANLSRCAAIVIGFTGVLVALRPDTGVDLQMLLPLGLAFIIALMFVVSRSLEGSSIFSLGFLPTVGSAVVTLALALPAWKTPELFHLIPVVLSGTFITIGIVCVSMAFRMAAAAAVSPMLYTEMIWAIIFGYLIFGDVPDGWMMAGAAIIIASGIYLVETERRVKSSP
jgi:drug/metabolite transporter (DMT)-like permease